MRPTLRLKLNFPADERGTSAVEFALLAPFFIAALLGMTAYGIYLGASHSVQQIAADAARIAISGLSRTERVALVEAYVSDHGGGYPFVRADDLSVEADASQGDASQFVVLVSYDARALPIWNLFPDLPMPDVTIQRRSTIRVGGQ